MNREEVEVAAVEVIAEAEVALAEAVAAEVASEEVGEDSEVNINRALLRLLLKLPLSPTPAKVNLSR